MLDDLVSSARAALAADGCCVLPGFLRPELVGTVTQQCAELAPHAYDTVETVNAYNIDVSAELAADHPARIPMERGNAFVARDRIPADALVQQLYTSEQFRSFIAACFGLPVLYELGDPLAGLCLNVIEPGRSHPWHFDTNEFTVSMLTQESDGGGDFEYCPNIRSASQENLAAVREVLEGSRGGPRKAYRGPVRTLALAPGDLQLFQGRYALHRVTEVTGERARHSVIFAYSERPGVIGSVARTRQLFGRVLPEHLTGRVRVDALLD